MAVEYMNGWDWVGSVGGYSIDADQGVLNLGDTGGGGSSSIAPRTGPRSWVGASGANFFGATGRTNATAYVIAGACKFDDISQIPRSFFGVGDGTPFTAATTQVSLGLNTSGFLEVYRGRAVGATSGGTLLGTSSVSLINSFYAYIELDVTVHPSAGTVDVYVDGENVLSLTGQNTRNTANTQINSWGVNGYSGGMFVDDFIVISNVGASPTSRVGEILCVTRLGQTDATAGAGDLNNSTPSSGSDRGAMVDDALQTSSSDLDTTYNAFAAAGDMDSYKHPAVALTGTVIAVRAFHHVKKQTTANGQAQVGVRISGTNYMGTAADPGAVDYKMQHKIWEQSPATAVAWTVSEINSAQIVSKRTL